MIDNTTARLSHQHKRLAIVQVLHKNHLQWLTYLATYLVAAFFVWRNVSYLPGAILACIVTFQISASIVYGWLEGSVYHTGLADSEKEEARAIEKMLHYREQHFDLQRLGNCVFVGLTVWIIRGVRE